MDYVNSCLPAFLVEISSPVLIGFSVYACVSTLLYYYPTIVPRSKLSSRPYNFVVVSHRGGSGENNENTMSAFKHSREIGVDVIELDCHLTKDGQVVVSHDNNLTRIAGVNKLISDFNFNELPQIQEDVTEDIFLNKPLKRTGSSSSLNHRNSSNGTESQTTSESRRIPLLEEVFKECPEMRINLDIKMDNDELIRKVNDLIIKYNREHMTVWGSFKESVTKKCYQLNPRIGLYFSAKGCWRLFVLIMTGLLPFWPLKETYFEVIMPNELLKKKNLPLYAVVPLTLVKLFFVRKSFVRHLQKRGITVYYWVLNSDEEFRKALEIGVDGIITDFPSKLIKFLEEDPIYKDKIIRPSS